MASAFLDRMMRRTSLRANIGANYLGRAWEAAMSVAFVPIYIAHLGAEAFGIIGIVTVIQTFMMILDFGIAPVLTREAARLEAGEHDPLYFRDLVRSSESIVIAVAVLIVAMVAITAPAIASDWVRSETLDERTIADALMVAGVLIAARFVESIYRGLLFGLQRQLLCNGLAAFFATVRGLGAVLLVAGLDAGLPTFFVWQAAVSLVSLMAMRISVGLALPRAERPGRFSADALRPVWRFAGGMMLISLLSLAATQGDKIVLSRIVPLADFGYYSFAVNIALLLQLATAPLMTALYPRIVGHVSERDEAGLRLTFHRWATIVSVATAPVAAILVIFGPTLILVWSQNPALAENAGALLSIIAIGTYLHSLCILPYYVQLAYGWTSLSIWTNAAALLITIPALLLLVPLYGTYAAAWTWVFVASVYLFVSASALFSRYLRGSRATFLALDIGVPTLAAFAAAGLCALALAGIPRTWLGNLFVLAVATAASFGAAAASALILARGKARLPLWPVAPDPSEPPVAPRPTGAADPVDSVSKGC